MKWKKMVALQDLWNNYTKSVYYDNLPCQIYPTTVLHKKFLSLITGHLLNLTSWPIAGHSHSEIRKVYLS